MPDQKSWSWVGKLVTDGVGGPTVGKVISQTDNFITIEIADSITVNKLLNKSFSISPGYREEYVVTNYVPNTEPLIVHTYIEDPSLQYVLPNHIQIINK